MNESEGVGQCVLTYDHDGAQSACGMTFFQCGVVPVVIFTDMNKGVSITNSIESAAATARAMHFLHIKADTLVFIEHYHRENGSDQFFQVKLRWSRMDEGYFALAFVEMPRQELDHLLSCYGYSPRDMPDLRFKPAKIIEFRRAALLA